MGGQNAAELINDQEWLESTFLPTVQQRGAAVIEARGASSAGSAANAIIGHMRDWVWDARGRLGVNVGPLGWLLSDP